MKRHCIWILAMTLVFSSCSQYERLRKSSNYALKYKKAQEYYEKGDFLKSGQLYDDIASVYRGTNKADTVLYYQAMSYFKQRDYNSAGTYFGSFIKNIPSSPFAEECEYLSGYCFYKLSPRAELDQETTSAAIEAFQRFIMHYPKSKFREEAELCTAEMQDKLVDKSYLSAKLYYNLSHYQSAIIALNNSLSDFPDTKYREELMYLLLKSSFLYAENSVSVKQKERYQATVDEYFSFIGEFPQSPYIKDAQRMYEKADLFLKSRPDLEENEEDLPKAKKENK